MEVKTIIEYKDLVLNKKVPRGANLINTYKKNKKELTNERIDVLLGGNPSSKNKPIVEVKIDDMDEVGGAGGGNVTMLTDVGESLFDVSRLIVEIPDLNTSEAISIRFFGMLNLAKLPNMNMSKANEVTFIGLPKITEISSLNLPVCKQLEIGDMENLETVGELNGFKPVNPVNLFYNCPNLTTIPVIDFSNVSSTMFAGGVFGYNGPSCPNLSDESLNNFLASLLTIQQNIMTKTLSEMSLDENQIARCQTLSNWPALQEKGWSA